MAAVGIIVAHYSIESDELLVPLAFVEWGDNNE